MSKFLKCASKYPEIILNGRITVEGNVIGCLWKDPLLLDDNKSLNDAMFISEEGRFYYRLAKFLRANNLVDFDYAGVYSIMSDKMKKRFDDYGGFETIQDITDSVSLNNWYVYLDNLMRENTFCLLYDMGVDCTKEQEWNGEKIIPVNVFRKCMNEDLLAFWDAKFSMLPTSTSSKIIEEKDIDFDIDWLSDLQKGIDQGDPFEEAFEDMFEEMNNEPIECYPLLSKSVAGLLPSTTTMLGSYSSVGKSTWWVGVFMALLSQGRKILVISNEESSSKLKQKMFVWIAKNCMGHEFSKRRLISGTYTDEDKQVIKDVQNFWTSKGFEKNIKYIFLNDPDISLVSKKIRENALRDGFDVVLYDTFKIQGNDIASNRQDLALVRDSRVLDQLAKKYNLIMLCSVQLAEHMKGKLWLDSSTLSNSKQIKEQLENLFLIRNVYEEELDPASKYYLRPSITKKVDGVYEEHEVQLDLSKTYKVLFIEKSRGGANSSDTGKAILLDFDGDHSTFKEVCYCRPRHGSIT